MKKTFSEDEAAAARIMTAYFLQWLDSLPDEGDFVADDPDSQPLLEALKETALDAAGMNHYLRLLYIFAHGFEAGLRFCMETEKSSDLKDCDLPWK